jgi:probable F420-dependent oxidoreductase
MTGKPLSVDYSLGKTLVSRAGPLSTAGALAARAESLGCGRVWTTETACDPFLPAVAALGTTNQLVVGTGVAVAFARSPMIIAQQAHDLQAYSGGRFVLGIGSQIKAHITRRYSMPWGKPIARMREMVGALRAIFAHWYDDATLDFEGEYYSFTFNSAPFRPPIPPGLRPPPIYLASVGPRMTALTGELADGYLSHSFITESFLREKILPALTRSRDPRRAPLDLVITCPTVVRTADETWEQARNRAKSTIGLYGSTPAYRTVLDHHGLGALHEELNRLSRLSRWSDLPDLIDDDTLELFCVVREDPMDAAIELLRRFGPLATSLRLPEDALAVVEPLTALVAETAPAK